LGGMMEAFGTRLQALDEAKIAELGGDDS